MLALLDGDQVGSMTFAALREGRVKAPARALYPFTPPAPRASPTLMGLVLAARLCRSVAYFAPSDPLSDLPALSITLRTNSYCVWTSRSAISIAESTTSCRLDGPSPCAGSA